MNTRRLFLKSVAVSLTLLKAGLLFPGRVFAEWPESAFSREKPDDAIAELFGNQKIMPTDKIVIEMPLGAENGAIIPITIKTNLKNIQTISLIAEKNPVALLAQFSFSGKGSGEYLRTRIKLARSSHVIVVVEAGGELCTAKKYIEVLKGGCD